MTATEDVTTSNVIVFDEPRSRRLFSGGDVIRLLVGLLLVVGGSLLARVAQSTIEGLETDLLNAVARLPSTIEEAALGLAQLATGLITPAVLIVLLIRRQWRVALLLLAAGVAASFAMTMTDAVVADRDLADALASLESGGAIADPAYPNSNVVAALTAVVTVSAPWLSSRWRRALWGAVGMLVLLRLLALANPAFDFVVALGVGTSVGSAFLLVFGSPVRRPGPDELVRALGAVGLGPRELRPPEIRGTTLRYDLDDRAGGEFTVVLRTPDERDAELLNRLYRRLRYRAVEVRAPYATVKRRIEHEVLVLTLAQRGDVRVPNVAHIGVTDGGSAFYVTPRLPLRPAEPDDLRDAERLAEIWTQLAKLHAAGIAHRRLALEAIRVDVDGRPWLVDFDRGQTAPTQRERARDVAQLLTETAIVVGATAAVDAAVASLDDDDVASALRMLQPLALPHMTRRRAKAVRGLLEELRAAVTNTTGAPELALEDLERIKPRTLIIVGASALAFYTLLPQLADFGETVNAFADAQPVWLVGTLLASALTYVFAAISFQGAVAEPIPFGPNLRAQIAAAFAGLVGPSGAGGFALTGRFLERAGVGAAEAGASVAVNAIAGFVVHVVLMAGFLLWAGETSLGSFSLPDSHTVLLVIAILFAVVGALLAVRPVRRRLLTPMWATVRTGLSQISQVFTSPQRVAQLFGGSTGLSLAYVAAVALTIQAFGGGLSIPQIAAAYLGAVAIATLAPTPGGLGALESAMIAGFTGFGLDDGVAVSATLTFRLFTFWLPTLPGWFVFNWMQRNDEL